MAVNTKQVVGRRTLSFSSYQDILDDVHALASKPTRQLGNWSLGKICLHLAGAMDMAIDGAPFKPAWYIRAVGPLLKKRFLSRPMTPGFQLPRNAGTLMPGDSDTAASVTTLEKAIQRLQQTRQRKRHVIFGNLTHEEWDRLQLLHAAMHLSFIVPE